LILANDAIRERAISWVRGSPKDTRVTFQEPKRTLDQNALMWLWLTAVATQLDWHGQRYSADDWKDYFMHALRHGRWMPSEEGGMVPIGMRTSDLSKEEMSDLLEVIMEFAARHGIEPAPVGVAA
jgi:hypothetical protein